MAHGHGRSGHNHSPRPADDNTAFATGVELNLGLVAVAVIVWGTQGVLCESVNLVFGAMPKGVGSAAVQLYLESFPDRAAERLGRGEVKDSTRWRHVALPARGNGGRL